MHGARPLTPSWIFFDLGYTLIDEGPSQRARLAQASALLARRGVEVSADELWRLNEGASSAFARFPFLSVLARLGLPDDAVQEIRATARYDHAHERLYPGVPSLLARLANSFRLGVIANQSLGTEARLREHGILQHFSVVAASAELGLAKPDPAIFHWALERAGCAPEQAVMVGDRLDNDVGPAKRLGLQTVRVLQGFARGQQARSPEETADRTIESIVDLPEVLAVTGSEE